MNRSYAATKMNHQSSRSHALYRLWVQSMPRCDRESGLDIDEDKKSVISQEGMALASTQAVINFIDLAGSERASVHEGMAATSVPIGATIRNPSPFGSTHRSSSRSNLMSSGKHTRINEGKYINKSLFFLT